MDERSRSNQLAEKRKRLAELKLRKEILDLQARIDTAKSFRQQSIGKADAVPRTPSEGGGKKGGSGVLDRVRELSGMPTTTRKTMSPVPARTTQYDEPSEKPIARKKIRSPVRAVDVPAKLSSSRSDLALPSLLKQDDHNVERDDLKERLAALEKDMQVQTKVASKLGEEVSKLGQTIDHSLEAKVDKSMKHFAQGIETSERKIVDTIVPSAIDAALGDMKQHMQVLEKRINETMNSEFEMRAKQQSQSLDEGFVRTLIKDSHSSEYTKVEERLKKSMKLQHNELKKLREENSQIKQQLSQFTESESTRLETAVSTQVEKALKEWIVEQNMENESLRSSLDALSEENESLRQKIQQFDSQMKQQLSEFTESESTRLETAVRTQVEKAQKEWIVEQNMENESLRRSLNALNEENGSLRQKFQQFDQKLSADVQSTVEKWSRNLEAKLSEHCNTKIAKFQNKQVSIQQSHERATRESIRQCVLADVKDEGKSLRSVITENFRGLAEKVSTMEEMLANEAGNPKLETKLKDMLLKLEGRTTEALSELKAEITKLQAHTQTEGGPMSVTVRSKSPGRSISSRPNANDLTSRQNTNCLETNKASTAIESQDVISKKQAVLETSESGCSGSSHVKDRIRKFEKMTSAEKLSAEIVLDKANSSSQNCVLSNKPQAKLGQKHEQVKVKTSARTKKCAAPPKLKVRTTLVDADDSSDDDSSVGSPIHEISRLTPPVEDLSRQFHEEYQYVSDVESSASSHYDADIVVESVPLEVGTAAEPFREGTKETVFPVDAIVSSDQPSEYFQVDEIALKENAGQDNDQEKLPLSSSAAVCAKESVCIVHVDAIPSSDQPLEHAQLDEIEQKKNVDQDNEKILLSSNAAVCAEETAFQVDAMESADQRSVHVEVDEPILKEKVGQVNERKKLSSSAVVCADSTVTETTTENVETDAPRISSDTMDCTTNTIGRDGGIVEGSDIDYCTLNNCPISNKGSVGEDGPMEEPDRDDAGCLTDSVGFKGEDCRPVEEPNHQDGDSLTNSVGVKGEDCGPMEVPDKQDGEDLTVTVELKEDCGPVEEPDREDDTCLMKSVAPCVDSRPAEELDINSPTDVAAEAFTNPTITNPSVSSFDAITNETSTAMTVETERAKEDRVENEADEALEAELDEEREDGLAVDETEEDASEEDESCEDASEEDGSVEDSSEEDEPEENTTEDEDENNAEEGDCSTERDDDRLVGVEQLNIADSNEVELRRRALALLGIGDSADSPSVEPVSKDGSSSSDEEDEEEDEGSCDDPSECGEDNGRPRSVLRPSSFLKEGFDWTKRPQLKKSPVSFSDDVKLHEIPRWDPEQKIDLFYDKVDINRFRMEDAAKKQAKANKEKLKLHTAIDSLPSFWG